MSTKKKTKTLIEINVRPELRSWEQKETRGRDQLTW